MNVRSALVSVLKPPLLYFAKVFIHGIPLALLMFLPFLGILFGFPNDMIAWIAGFAVLPVFLVAFNNYLLHYLWGEPLTVRREELVACEYQMFMFIIFLAIHLPLLIIWSSFNLQWWVHVLVFASYCVVDGYLGREVGGRLRKRRYAVEGEERTYVQATCPNCLASYSYPAPSPSENQQVICQNCAKPFQVLSREAHQH